MDRVTCKFIKNGRECGRYLGRKGPSCIFESAPCAKCNKVTQIYQIETDVDVVASFKFTEDPYLKHKNAGTISVTDK